MTSAVADSNIEQARAWDGDEGADWVRDDEYYNRANAGYRARLHDTLSIASGDRVLDIGCGCGESTRDAARAAAPGRVLGLDLSAQMLARARELSAADALTNVEYVQGDAQVHPFEPAAFDLAISRFGAMFFGDQPAAFSNIAGALRPGGALALVAWQDFSENEWLLELIGALAAGRRLPRPPAGSQGPMGLSDPDQVRATLTNAGFRDVEFADWREPMSFGTDAEDAYTFMENSGVARGLLGGLDEAQRRGALDAMRAVMTAHETGDGVVFGSAAWFITAHRA